MFEDHKHTCGTCSTTTTIPNTMHRELLYETTMQSLLYRPLRRCIGLALYMIVMLQEPCEYRCLHIRCKKRCGEICDRTPCTESCYMKLPCNHRCVGFCGEPCPPCKQCSSECYQPHYDVFGGPDEEEDESEK